MSQLTHNSFLQSFDTNIRPQDDFFGHVNNQWLGKHPIPASESRWGSFNILRDEAWNDMKEIYEELQNQENLKPNSVEQQARDLYYTATQTNKLKEAHLETIHEWFDRIETISTTQELSKLLGQLHEIDVNVPWHVGVDSDQENSTRHILHIYQGGLTLPNRDYYLETSDKMQDIQTKYKQHLAKVHELFPEIASSAKEFTNTIWQFEFNLAKHSRSSEDLRDVEKNFNRTTYSKLKTDHSNIDWNVYAKALGWKTDDKITVDQPEFLAFVNQQMTTLSLDIWKIYLKWQFLLPVYSRISEEYAAIKFDFFGKVLSGTSEIMPLWKRATLTIDDLMGEGVGKLYAERHFPESSKKQVLNIVEHVRDTYKRRIQKLDWMENETKTYAIKKLDNMKVLIGYPEKWRDFSGFTVGRESLIDNILNGKKFEAAYYMQRLHEPTSRDDWFMYPQTVNAYNDPTRLVICFPAAILQTPFFNPKASAAENYGGIGTVVGHELTHGFDDQGCQFDAEGNVKTWQTKQDRENFDARAKVIIDQADNFEVLPGLNLKGQLVIGESIADLGGLELAFDALTSLPEDQQTGADNLTAKQLFFAAYAATECDHTREAKKREYALNDPHPESTFRVNGMLQHVDGFYEAFEVTEGDKLFRPKEKRAAIW